MDADRRSFLIAGMKAATVGAGLGGAATMGASVAPVGAETPPPLDGALRFDDEARAAVAEDFGHILRRLPEGVLAPRSDADVGATIRWAGGTGRRVAARGRGHSVYGRAQSQDGIVIDMSQLRAIHEVQSDRVVVDAGATWSDVLRATLPHGLTPPVLPDYLGLSVGGTLVVGGIGGTTSRFGLQCDNVLDMEVVTGTGQKVICSPSHHANLFDAIRAGLGQVAVITRATLKLVAAPSQVRRLLLCYSDLATMLTDQRLLVAEGRFDAVQGAILPSAASWIYRLEAVQYFSGSPPDDDALLAGLSDERSKAELTTSPYFDYLNRLAKLEQTLRSNGQWLFPHPWLTTFVGDSVIEAVVGGELSSLTPADLGTFGQVVLSAFTRQAARSPLLQLPADDVCFAFNLIRFPTSDDRAEADQLVVDNRAIYERVRAAGGTLYPVSALPMDQDDWRRHFGSAFGLLAKAKRTFDPGNVLTPGYEIF